MGKKVVKPKGSYRHGNLREAILRTSLRLIQKHGIEKLSIREAAKAAGVSHQAPYRHFKDRDALLAALAQDGLEKLYGAMCESARNSDSALDRLVGVAEGYFDWAASNPEHFRLMFGRSIPDHSASEGLQKASADVLQLVLTVVDDNQKSGNVRKEETRAVARQFWAAVHGASILFIDDQFKPLGLDTILGKRLARDIVTNLVNGLRPR